MGQSGNKGDPRYEAATSEATEDTKAESTEADIGEAVYLVERIRSAERNKERAK